MTQQLTDAFRALADDLEAGVVGPPPETVWRAGSRRRWRRRGGVGLAVGAVIAVFALVVAPGDGLSTMPAGRDTGRAVTAYPQRIGHQWFTGTFQAGDGPVAMVVERVTQRDGADWPLGWFAVSPRGHESRLDLDGYGMPTVSPDGRWVGYWAGAGQGYLLQATTSAKVVRFRDVPDPQAQAPSYWNARGDHVFVPSSSSSGDVGVVLGLDGTEVVVARGPAGSFPYGWIGDGLVALAPRRTASGTAFAVQTWTSDGHWTTSGTLLDVPEYAADQGLTQFTASVSPDGTRLAVAVPQGGGTALPTYLFDLPGGSRVRWNQVDVSGAKDALGSASVPYADNTCPMAWKSGLPLGQFDGNALAATGGAGLVLGRWQPSGESEPLTVTEARLGVRCVLVAADALGGGPTWSLFGTADNLFVWWWRELLAGLAAALVGIALVRRARARRQASSAILAP